MRASGLQGDASPEIIEILDDDTTAFGDRAPSHTMHDAGGPRWIGPAAATALVALIGYGVATSASTPSAPKAATITTSTVVTSTTQPPPPTTAPPLVPAYAAEPPAGFTAVYAKRLSAVPSDVVVGPAVAYELWGTADASATNGRWFSVSIDSYGDAGFYGDNAYRTTVGGLTAVVPPSDDGRKTVQFTPDHFTHVTVTTFGWDDQQLARLVAAIGVQAGAVTFADTWFAADHSKLTTVAPWTGVFTQPVEQIVYAVAGGSQQVSVGVNPIGSQSPGGADRDTALRFELVHRTPFEVDGHSAIAGVTAEHPPFEPGGTSQATWVDGDNIVTVTSDLPLSQVIAFARTVHRVPDSEWKDFEAEPQVPSVEPTSNDQPTSPLPVSFGTDATGKTWTIEAGTWNDSFTYWQEGGSGWIGSHGGGSAKIAPHVDSTRTYVTAELPRAVAATAELRVNRDGLDTVVVPFTDIGPNLDRTLAAYVFSEPVQYTAEIVAPDGTVLATWPSP